MWGDTGTKYEIQLLSMHTSAPNTQELAGKYRRPIQKK